MSKVSVLAVAAGLTLATIPLAVNAQDVSGGREPTESVIVNGPVTWPHWAIGADEWSPPREGRIAADWVYGNRFDNPDAVIWNDANAGFLRARI